MFSKLFRFLLGFVMVLAIFGCDKRSYEFVFFENGGSYVEGLLIDISDYDPSTMPVSTRPGFAFAGWYIDEGLTEPLASQNLPAYHTQMNLYAKWTPADAEVSVQYWRENLNGDYYLFELETIGGITGTPVTANPKEYPGYEENPAHPDWVLSGTPQEGIPLVLRLYYSLRSYSLTFLPNNGTEPSGRPYLFGESIVYPDEPVRQYYSFAGWYGDPDYLSNQFLYTVMPAWNCLLYAKWDPIPVTLTFVTNGGTAVSPFTAGALTNSTFVIETEKAGYLLEGWYTDAGFTTKHSFGVMPGTDLTLYAKWLPEASAVTVKHYFESTSQPGLYFLHETVQTFGEVGVLFTAVPLESPGFVLHPSHPDQVASGTPEVGYHPILKLYYQLETYHLIFEENGGSEVADATAKYYSTLDDLPQSIRAGFNLTWCVDEELLFELDSIDYAMPAHDLTLYARWTRFDVYLDFVTNGGGTLASQLAETGSAYVLPIPVYAGHTFGGWYVDEELTEAYGDPGVMPNESMTLYAKWFGLEVAVSFETNGGSAVEDVIGFALSTWTMPGDPAYAGYTFAGWYVDDDLTTPFVGTGLLPESNLTLYAKWTPNSYTLSFDEDGGSLVEDLFLPVGTAIEEPADPLRAGWIFGGWTTDVGHATAYQFTTMPPNNVTVYAYWMPKYVVIGFETNGGSLIDNASGRALSAWTMPADPIWTDHTFAGWYLDAGFTEAYVDTGTFPNDNLTLFARWYGAEYWITFDMMNGQNIPGIQVAVGATIYLPEPAWEGFIFAGWYADPILTIPFTQTIMTAETIRLYAKWTFVS